MSNYRQDEDDLLQVVCEISLKEPLGKSFNVIHFEKQAEIIKRELRAAIKCDKKGNMRASPELY